MDTPVVLILFNRPEPTARTFAAIRAAAPRRLLLIADGPRPDRPGEAELCRQARAVAEAVDWPCTVSREFSDVNLGCRRRIASGLDWAFREVESAIILEDDCVPMPSFFPYCAELLERYRDDERVFAISGTSLSVPDDRGGASYDFSRYPLVWGWATWRRAWRHYDVDIAKWPALRDGGWLRDILGSARAARYWHRHFERIRAGFNTWDWQLVLAAWTQGGLCIVPRVNMIRNIGFNADATHTHDPGNPLAARPVSDTTFPLVHPPFVIRNARADAIMEMAHYSGKWSRRLKQRLRGLFNAAGKRLYARPCRPGRSPVPP